jgi:hypothetical protein
MSRTGPDGQAGFLRSLQRSAELAGVSIDEVQDDFQRWHSASFAGGRHLVVVQGLRCADLDRWLADLPGVDLDYRGHLVAEVAVIGAVSAGGLTTAHIEALTVEAA